MTVLSVVATLYRSEKTLPEFYRRVVDAAQAVTSDFDIVLVNDGSPDASVEVARQLQMADARLTVVDLSRNFGHHKAIMTGLSFARGEHVFLIDSDLEEEPEWLESFHAALRASASDVVYGVQISRRGSWFEKVSGDLYYRLHYWLTGLRLPRNVVTARLMTRRYVLSLLEYKERELDIASLWHATGFQQTAFPIQKHRLHPSNYSLLRKIGVAINAIASFSNRPLLIVFYTGIFVFVIGLGYTGWIAYRRIVEGIAVEGWASVMASMWLLGGLIILFNGVIGIYVAKIFTETKSRPYATVRAVYGGERRDGGETANDPRVGL